MSIKLKDTISDLINKANKDGSGNTITSTYLKLSGGTMTGALGMNSKYLIKPVAEYTTETNNITGAICITLPASIGSTMVSLWIDVYNYVTETSFSVHVGGYTYTNSTWQHNPSAMVYGANHKVRLGHNGTNFVIYIGEVDSKWNYPQISVRDVLLGFNGPSYSNWSKTWTIGFATEFSNVTATCSDHAITTKNYTTYCAKASHTHSYAGSGSAGGSATSAVKLDSSAGSATNPVYFTGGKPTACTYSLNKTVPSNAVFTDTTYSTATSSTLGLVKIGYTQSGRNYPVELSNGQMYVTVPWTDTNTDTDTKNTAGSTNSSSKLYLIGATSQAANPQTYSHDTAYVGTDGCLYSNSTKVSVEGHTHNYLSSLPSHTHSYIVAKDNYTFTSSTLPNSFDLGVSAGFVNSDSGFGSYGSVLTVRTYSGGGGTLQLYAPYSNTYGGSRLKARFGNYDSSSGNSWTTLKELAWTGDIGNGTITIKQGGTSKGTFTVNQSGNTTIELTDSNTTYGANNGVGLSGTTFYNSGVRSISTGTSNGTISVNTNGTAANVAVKGLGSAAYTASTAYAAASHNHSNHLSMAAYNFSSGCLVKTDIPTASNTMITFRIEGNSYGSKTILTTGHFYNYKDNNQILNADATNHGYSFGDISVFCYNNNVYLWFKQQSSYQSFIVYVYSSNDEYSGLNRAVSISNSAIPSSGVTRKVVISPKTGLDSSNWSAYCAAASHTHDYAASGHTHNYASTVKVGSTSYTCSSNVISLPAYPTVPTSLKCPTSLTIQANGTSLGSYDGSAAKTFNITYSNVGAAAASHSHTFASLTSKPTTISGFGITDAYTPAKYNTTASHSGYYKIKINSTEYWMMGFRVRVYKSYQYFDIRFSGYNYGSNYWYSPVASLVEGDAAITVYFGYDSASNLWVGIPAGNYTGIEITDAVNGYQPHKKGLRLDSLFTITQVSSLGGTTQSTQTIQPPSKAGHTHSYAASSHTHTKSQITDFSHTHNYAGSSSAGGDANNSVKWGGYKIVVGSTGTATDTIYFIT